MWGVFFKFFFIFFLERGGAENGDWEIFFFSFMFSFLRGCTFS